MMKFLCPFVALILVLSTFTGCNHAPEKEIEDSATEDTQNTDLTQLPQEQPETTSLLLENYLGTWYDDFYPPNIFQIMSDTNGKIECELSPYRVSTYHLNINFQIEEITFTDKYNLISGTIEPKNNSVLVTITESNTKDLFIGASWLFTIKHDESGNTRSLEEYVGTWYDDFYPPNIFQIMSDTNGKIECELDLYKVASYYLNISIQMEEITFTDNYNLISGTIELKDNSVLVTVTESNSKYLSVGASWLFKIKDEEDFT